MLLTRLFPAFIVIALVTAILKLTRRHRPLLLRSDGTVFCWPEFWQRHTSLRQAQAVMKPFYTIIKPHSADPVTVLKEASVRGCYFFTSTGSEKGRKRRTSYMLVRLVSQSADHSGYLLHHLSGRLSEAHHNA